MRECEWLLLNVKRKAIVLMYNRHATTSSWQALAMIIQDISIDSKFKKKTVKGSEESVSKAKYEFDLLFFVIIIYCHCYGTDKSSLIIHNLLILLRWHKFL